MGGSVPERRHYERSEAIPAVSIYHLDMNGSSGSFRASVIQAIIKCIKDKDKEVVVCEPELHESDFFKPRMITDLSEFEKINNVIVTNRLSSYLLGVNSKVYTRELLCCDLEANDTCRLTNDISTIH